ncbi:hypothetical protein KKG83_01915 [Candidatus Micrarchaeota archaeon]|nr:hypothetical protein [Candidatus Micrarchaeota archaeon]MBU2476206.1 hypothetical protein [Candidatus Micrarchaeota archaeon]
MPLGLHHLEKRKRIYKKLEPYPHPDKWKRFLDKLIYFVGIFTPIITIPQLLDIWIGKNAVGVSLVSWTGYLIAVCFWFLYGLAHKEKPIIISYGLLVVMDFFVVVGILLYG